MEAKILLGRPTWRWDLYFFTANAVCCALSPFLRENISFCGCSNDVKRCAPIRIHVLPDFPEETMHGDCVAHVQTLRDKNFCCAEFAIIYVAIACRCCTVNKETTWMRKATHNILHNPKWTRSGSIGSLSFDVSGTLVTSFSSCPIPYSILDSDSSISIGDDRHDLFFVPFGFWTWFMLFVLRKWSPHLPEKILSCSGTLLQLYSGFSFSASYWCVSLQYISHPSLLQIGSTCVIPPSNCQWVNVNSPWLLLLTILFCTSFCLLGCKITL